MGFASPKPERSADPFRVMLVDDSAVIRGLFARTLEADPEIEIVASVSDGLMALTTLEKNIGKIEVVVLDIEMPRMDGLTALPKLIETDRDTAVVMASTLTERNADIAGAGARCQGLHPEALEHPGTDQRRGVQA